MNSEQVKYAVCEHAAKHFVKSGFKIGLGTGSTVYHFIKILGEKLGSGEISNIECVATSVSTEKLANEYKIPLMRLDQCNYLDVTVDGADEIDNHLNLIKGRGAALLREKMVACHSKKVVILAESHKVQPNGLGLSGAIPIEVNKFGVLHIMKKIKEAFGDIIERCEVRTKSGSHEYLETDNQNYIVDVYVSKPITKPNEISNCLKTIVGVVEHGFFLNIATECLIGYTDGTVKTMTRST